METARVLVAVVDFVLPKRITAEGSVTVGL